MSKPKKTKAKQDQWQKESKMLHNFWEKAPQIKKAAIAKGYSRKYFEFLDSYEAIFNEVALAARFTLSSIVNICEVPNSEFENVVESRYGVPNEWTRVGFDIDDIAASTYGNRDLAANMKGSTTFFLQDDGETLRTLILIPQSMRCDFEHRDLKYHNKLAILLHEIGHVVDAEKNINLDVRAGKADIISAEVHANLYAMNEADRLGLFHVAGTLYDSLKAYIGSSDYRGDVARKVVEQYVIPTGDGWQELI